MAIEYGEIMKNAAKKKLKESKKEEDLSQYDDLGGFHTPHDDDEPKKKRK